jgi:N-acetylmuramoyl-L-alanine amidase
MLTTVLFSIVFNAQAGLKVVIDPGHGGADAGAVYGQAKESEISLQVAKKLKALLDKKGGFQTTLTRVSDQNLSLPERVNLAESSKADLFLSIHTNASPDQKARGAEFYFQNQLPADEESMYLANSENKMLKEVSETEKDSEEDLSKKSDVLAIIKDLKRHNKMMNSFTLSNYLYKSWFAGTKKSSAIRQAPFYVISKTSIPSVLIELGFLSNPKEAEKLTQAAVQAELAQKIMKGLIDYKEMVDKSEIGRLQ